MYTVRNLIVNLFVKETQMERLTKIKVIFSLKIYSAKYITHKQIHHASVCV